MVLVTGNAGFIGRYLTDALREEGHEIRGIDIRPRKDAEEKLSQIDGNILDDKAVRKAMDGADCIIHLAAEHKDFGIAKDQYHKVNVEGTKVILEAASEFQIKKFIFYSSVSVYGAHQPSCDDTLPEPNNDYGISKYQAEAAIIDWAQKDNDRKVVIIRPTVVFGPRNQANIFRLVRQVSDGNFIWVGNGENVKSIAYVENLVDATVFLLLRMQNGVSVMNYADKPHLTTREIVNLIAQKAGVPTPNRIVPKALAIGASSVFDVIGNLLNRDFPITSKRIRKFNTPTHHEAEKIFSMGFHPRFTVAEGIERMVRWYLEQRDSLNYLESAE
jgi:nucleoside-diphosphate-sugar epimerase